MLEDDLLIALNKTLEIGGLSPNSNNRMDPIVEFFAKESEKHLGKKYAVHCNGRKGGEYNLLLYNGNYHKVDLASRHILSNIVGSVMEFKSFLSSYQKNKQNYKNGLFGETMFIQRSDPNCDQVVFIPDYMPVFKTITIKDDMGKEVKYQIYDGIDYFKDDDARSYRLEMSWPYKETCDPHGILIKIFSTGNLEFLKANLGKKVDKQELVNSMNPSFCDLDDMLYIKDPENINFLKENGDVEEFILEYCSETRAKMRKILSQKND